jgi:hypothetical protein
MITRLERSEPAGSTTNRFHPIPSASNRYLDHQPCQLHRRRRMAHAPAPDDRRSAARHRVIHLDELPPVGVICFQQPSGLPSYDGVGPASVKTQDAAPDAMLGDLDVVEVMGPSGGRSAAKAWSSCPPEPGGSWRPSTPGALQAWSSRASRSPLSPAATCWCCEDGGAGSTGLRHRQAGLDLGPQDPTGTRFVRHQNETRIRPHRAVLPAEVP